MFLWDIFMGDVMDSMLDWVYAQLIGFLANFFNLMDNMGANLFDVVWVQGIVLFFSYLAWALFVIGIVVAVFEYAIEQDSGRSSIAKTLHSKGIPSPSEKDTWSRKVLSSTLSNEKYVIHGIISKADFEMVQEHKEKRNPKKDVLEESIGVNIAKTSIDEEKSTYSLNHLHSPFHK